jgi:YVTN family beta-propeller protein
MAGLANCDPVESRPVEFQPTAWPGHATSARAICSEVRPFPKDQLSTEVPVVNQTLILANNTTMPGLRHPIADYAGGPTLWNPANGLIYLGGSRLMMHDGRTGLLVGWISFPTPDWSYALTYDPANHDVYVALGGNRVLAYDSQTNALVANISVGDSPTGIAYDAANGNLYVTNWVSHNVTVIDGLTNQVVGAIAVGINPGGVAYDPLTGDLLVTEGGTVAIINGSSNRVVGNTSGGNGAIEILYDPVDGKLYVSDYHNNTITVINGTTERPVRTIPVGSLPWGAALDTARNTLYVPNGGDSSVSIVNLTTDRVIGTIATGLGDGNSPAGGAFDPATDLVFVADECRLPIFNASSANLSRTITLCASPATVLFDPQNRDLYVADIQNDWVWVVDSATNTVRAHIQVGLNPWAMALDTASGQLFVANQDSRTISVINTTTDDVTATWGTGYYPTGLAFDPANGHLFESNSVYGSDIGVFDVASGMVVDDIQLNSDPSGLLYDPVNGDLYVGDNVRATGQPQVEVFNATNDQPTTQILLPSGSDTYAMALDGASGNIYVDPAGATVIWVIDASTNAVLTNVSATTWIWANIAYDPVHGQVLLSGRSGNLLVINATTQRMVGSLHLSLGMADVAVDPATGTVYATSLEGTVLQLVEGPFTVEVNTSARISEVRAPLEFNATISGISPSSSSVWTFGDGVTSANLSTSHAYLAPGLYVANLTVTDPLGTPLNFSENITVLPALTLGGVATPTVIDQGQSLNLTALVGQGGPPYAISWTFGDDSPSGTITTRNLSSVVSHRYLTPGDFLVELAAQDRFVNRSFSTFVTVEPSPSVRITMGPTSTTVGAGFVVRANFTGGILPYYLTWDFGDGTGATATAFSSSPIDTLSPAHQFAAPGIYSVKLSITDSAGESSLPRLSVKVLPVHTSASRPPLFYRSPAAPASPAVPASSGGPMPIVAVLALTVAILVAFVVWLAWTERRAGPPKRASSRPATTGSRRSSPTERR